MFGTRSPRVLIISMRYLGDCLLSASLAAPIREAFPDARIDILTYQSNVGILEGVEGINKIIVVQQKPSKKELIKELWQVKGQYDWAIAVQDNVRSILFAHMAARHQVMYRSAHRWHNRWISYTVLGGRGQWLDRASRLLEPIIGKNIFIASACPDGPLPENMCFEKPYVVLQPCSRYLDKEWVTSHWQTLIQRTQALGFDVVITGGPGKEELQRIDSIVKGLHVRVVAGELSFGQTARLIRGASAYVGVDTATTHVAAATGIPVITLFGPTDVEVWAPSPINNREDFFTADKALCTIGNVTVIRNVNYLHCRVCSRHRCPLHRPTTYAQCMQSLGVDVVWSSLERVLAETEKDSVSAMAT